MNNPWQSIDTAPREQWLEVCGDSGYANQRWFIINAEATEKYSDGRLFWLDATGEPLSDHGWTPLFWRLMTSLPRAEPKEVQPSSSS